MDQAKKELLISRITHVVQAARLETFSAKQLAKSLGADKYDVLYALHAMLDRGAVEWLSTVDVFTDLWRRKRPTYLKPISNYLPEQTPVCSILEVA